MYYNIFHLGGGGCLRVISKIKIFSLHFYDKILIIISITDKNYNLQNNKNNIIIHYYYMVNLIKRYRLHIVHLYNEKMT